MSTEYPLTPVGLEAQSRAAIKAWCDDPSVLIEYSNICANDNVWLMKDKYPCFDLEAYHYRIANPKKWYRVAKFDGGGIGLATTEGIELEYNKMPGFIEWLTKERVYYD